MSHFSFLNSGTAVYRGTYAVRVQETKNDNIDNSQVVIDKVSVGL